MKFISNGFSKNKSGIYLIKNLINNKFYIGSTINFRKRYNNHIYSSKKNKNGCTYLQKSFLKYGIENFSFEIIEISNLENLIKREQLYINLLKPNYNIAKVAGSCLGVKRSEEFCKKNSILHKGKTISKEQREKQSKSLKGIKRSKETLEKMSKAQKGRVITEEVRRKISKSLSGRVGRTKGISKTEEQKEKIRKTLKEKYPKGSIWGRAKPIYQYSIEGKFIAEYHSIEKAALELNITSHKIRSYLDGRTKTGAGFIWKRNKE